MSERGEKAPPRDLLSAVVEALVFSSGEPLSVDELAEVLQGIERDELERAIGELERRYSEHGSGLRLERVAGGLQLATRSAVGPWVRRFFRQRNRARISAASLETLAVVAYRQPVTAPEIQAIRGKDPTASLKTLLEKKLIRMMGKKKVVGRPILYGTTRHFLMHFGLNGLEDLPAFEEFEKLVGALESLDVTEGPGEDATGDRFETPAPLTAQTGDGSGPREPAADRDDA